MFIRVLVFSIPLGVGGSQVWEAEKWIELGESCGILPTGTVWDWAREITPSVAMPTSQTAQASVVST